jgi:hypothetical protein
MNFSVTRIAAVFDFGAVDPLTQQDCAFWQFCLPSIDGIRRYAEAIIGTM